MEKIVSFDKQGRLYLPEELRKYLQFKTFIARAHGNGLYLQPIEEDPLMALSRLGAEKLKDKSLEVAQMLRDKNINTEIYLDENAKLDKQLKYADRKGIPYAIIIGPDEEKNNTVTLRNMTTRTEGKNISLENLIQKLQE